MIDTTTFHFSRYPKCERDRPRRAAGTPGGDRQAVIRGVAKWARAVWARRLTAPDAAAPGCLGFRPLLRPARARGRVDDDRPRRLALGPARRGRVAQVEGRDASHA